MREKDLRGEVKKKHENLKIQVQSVNCVQVVQNSVII